MAAPSYMPTGGSRKWRAAPLSRAVGTSRPAPAPDEFGSAASAAVHEEAAEIGDPDRDQQRGQRCQDRQRSGQVARGAHPDVSEDGGANRGGDHDRRGDTARPLLMPQVDRNLSP